MNTAVNRGRHTSVIYCSFYNELNSQKWDIESFGNYALRCARNFYPVFHNDYINIMLLTVLEIYIINTTYLFKPCSNTSFNRSEMISHCGFDFHNLGEE